MPEPIDPGLSEVAAALAALRPNPPAIDRDRVLFDAGRASAPRALALARDHGRFWDCRRGRWRRW